MNEIRGHDSAIALWDSALQGGRMHHAWLLCGQRGIGKASLARNFARRLLDIPEGNDTVFAHPDLLVLEREWDDKRKRHKSFISVENVRRVSDFFAKSAARDGWRACIIDSADEMNLNAANALLKILEEPPRQSLFLLASHQPERLLPTLLSRCRRLRLNPLGNDEMLALLQQNYPNLSVEQHERLLLLSEGSPGRAFALVESGGLELYTDMMSLFEGLPNRFDMSAAHVFADRLSALDQEKLYREFMELLRGFLERFVRASAGGGALPVWETRLLEHLASDCMIDLWISVWEKIDGWLDDVERLQMNRKQTLLLAFAQIEAAAQKREI